MPWRWDGKVGRYRHVNGSQYFLSRKTALSYVQGSLDVSGAVTDRLAEMVSTNLVAPGDWRDLMRREIKDEYIRQYLQGAGGRAQMTQADWGSVGGMLKDQYRYLDDFAREVAEGKLSEAQIAARSRMYVHSAREAYERAHGRVAKKLGHDQEAWDVNPVLENCEDCLAFEAEGWQEIGHFPEPGSGGTRCLTNCGCAKRYRNSKAEEEWQG